MLGCKGRVSRNVSALTGWLEERLKFHSQQGEYVCIVATSRPYLPDPQLTRIIGALDTLLVASAAQPLCPSIAGVAGE
jgi:hypothetical protein